MVTIDNDPLKLNNTVVKCEPEEIIESDECLTSQYDNKSNDLNNQDQLILSTDNNSWDTSIKMEAHDSDDDDNEMETENSLNDNNSIIFTPANALSINQPLPALSYIGTNTPPPLASISTLSSSSSSMHQKQNETTQALKTYLMKKPMFTNTAFCTTTSTTTTSTASIVNKQFQPNAQTIVRQYIQPIIRPGFRHISVEKQIQLNNTTISKYTSNEIPPLVVQPRVQQKEILSNDRPLPTTSIQNKSIDHNESNVGVASSTTSSTGVKMHLIPNDQASPSTSSSMHGGQYAQFASYIIRQMEQLPKDVAIELEIKIHNLIGKTRLAVIRDNSTIND